METVVCLERKHTASCEAGRCANWLAIHGHLALLAETFVDHSRFAGTCYRAAGWLPLGQTSGYGRKGNIYYYHGETKTIFVKPLYKDARKIGTKNQKAQSIC